MYLATADRENIAGSMAHAMGLIEPVAKPLARQFTDAQGRMLADPPTSAAELLDPKVLVVAHISGGDSENPAIPWRQFERHLAEVTGREVVDQEYDNSPAQLAQITDGRITLVALHAAETPFLVNHYGYQPVAVLGDDSGANGNHLDIIVPTGSPITRASDLRGHSLVCTLPSSITGYRSAVALLLHNEHLRPNVDYMITWSTGQKKSINGVVNKKFEAAAVSDDKLQGLLKRGQVSTSDYQVIYTSEVIPRTTIGWFYNLNPQLAAKVRSAILSYRTDKKAAKADAASEPAGDDSGDSTSKSLHFIPVDYKKDFKLVREINDSFDPRLSPKPSKSHAGQTPSTP